VKSVRLAIAVGVVLIGAGLAVTLLTSDEVSTGDNGREIQLPAGVIIPGGARACQPEASIPPGTGTVRLTVSTARLAAGPLEVTVVKGGTVLASARSRGGIKDERVKLRLGGPTAGATNARVCVANLGARTVAVMGQEVRHGEGARVTDPRQPQTRAMRLEWFTPNKTLRLSRVGDVAHRYGLVKASWVGTWTFWAALLVLLGASAGAVALVVREVRRS
jgi:hypothetical protein